MKTAGLFLLLCLLISACHHQPTGMISHPVPAKTLKESLEDSLARYIHLDNFLKQDDSALYTLYGNTINGNKIGLIAVTDSMLLLYQHIYGRFQLSDSVAYDSRPWSIRTADLNGDHMNELLVYDAPDIHGQSAPQVFMYGSDNILHYRPELHRYNISYDPDTRLVRTFYESCAVCVHSKETYRWEKDSLKFVAGVELDLSNPHYAEVRWYRRSGDTQQYYRGIKNADAYDTALFDISRTPGEVTINMHIQ